MQRYLIKFESDYADEFDVHGIMLCTEDELINMKMRVKSHDFQKQSDFYFGTNEALEFASYEQWEEDIEVTKVTDDIYVNLCRLFHVDVERGGIWGNFIAPGD